MQYEQLKTLETKQARQHIRASEYTGHTAGIAKSNLQGNVVILPLKYAFDFLRYCQRNPQSCPLITVSDTGNPNLSELGVDIDIRTDVPEYCVYKNGHLINTTTDILSLWQTGFVTFVIGCSFSFEQELLNHNIPIRHIENNKVVSMYLTNINTRPSGIFSGSMVVSMRPMKLEHIASACIISAKYSKAHGSPVHIGDPSIIGIRDINQPNWGDKTQFKASEVPVFWACGVTPQNAVKAACPAICITHSPGKMLITDLLA